MKTPYVITVRQLILNVADRWKKTYWPSWNGLSEDKWHQLCRLNKETCSAGEVCGIIGNESWTELRCDQCDKSKEALVVVGQEMDYESRTASLCLSCLEEAHQVSINAKIL